MFSYFKNNLGINGSNKQIQLILIGIALKFFFGIYFFTNSEIIENYLLFANKEGATYIISTPKGILSDKEALKLNVGGEVLLKIC